ncbi:MAG: SAM-dependent methyltransferase [Nitrospirales bacterium]|nr:MAG: SAM-dependent methyltransferase [Nitrospirales bacterium]
MAIKLAQVVPFGRSLGEYQAMFALSPHDRSKRILGVGDGPASFNAEMTALGHGVVSVDPLYELTGQDIQRQFEAVVDGIMAQVISTPADWVWTYHASPAALRANRIAALETFLADYDLGKFQQRYVIGELPKISQLPNMSFDLALCSHFLFLYADQFNLEFHQAALMDMLHMAPEVRVFPLMTLQGQRSAYVEPLRRYVREQGCEVGIQPVRYELQRGGNEMLWIRRPRPEACVRC